MVKVGVSFEDGVGNTFTKQEGFVRYFVEPALVSASPCCAPIEFSSQVLLQARDPSHLFESKGAQV
ncbi:MAG: hypothetical protein SGPRY_005180 [Prymnesium sp.]